MIQHLIQRFNREVNESHIQVDWDSGHCYSSIEHKIMSDVDELDLSEEDQEEWDQFTSDWLYDNDPPLYCVPELINELCGDSVVSCECGNKHGEELLDHVVEFIDLVKTRTGDSKEHSLKWYKIEQLEKWVHLQNLTKIVKS